MKLLFCMDGNCPFSLSMHLINVDWHLLYRCDILFTPIHCSLQKKKRSSDHEGMRLCQTSRHPSCHVLRPLYCLPGEILVPPLSSVTKSGRGKRRLIGGSITILAQTGCGGVGISLSAHFHAKASFGGWILHPNPTSV